MIKLLNGIGLYTRKQYNQAVVESGELKTRVANYNYMIFDFDMLLKNYSSAQLNALFYKLINLCRNDPAKKFLLGRWDKRVDSALGKL